MPRRLLLNCLAFLLCTAFLPVMQGAAPAGAKPPRKAASRSAKKKILKSRLSRMKGQITATRTRLRAAKRSEETITADLKEIKARLNQTRSRLAQAKRRLSATQKEQAKVAALLKVSQARLKARELALSQRMAANYRQGPVRYASVVLGSRSMGDFVTRAQFVRTIVRYDARLITKIKADRMDVLRWKHQVDEKARQVASLKQELAVRQHEEARDTIQQRAVLAEARARRAELEDSLDAQEADSSKIAAALLRLNRTPAGMARRMVAFSGRLIQPVPGGVVSTFGMRYHPILHRSRLHAGVDMSGSTGTPIVAAASGVVVFSGVMRGYGNVVVLDHGGGISTLYAHCSARLAHEGQSVAQGQVIARVGSTGLSTGPHLHFEVRRNGSPVNPLRAL